MFAKIIALYFTIHNISGSLVFSEDYECFFPLFKFSIDEVSNNAYALSGKSKFAQLVRTSHDIHKLFVDAEMDALELTLKYEKNPGRVLFLYLIYKEVKPCTHVMAKYEDLIFGSFIIKLQNAEVIYDGHENYLSLKYLGEEILGCLFQVNKPSRKILQQNIDFSFDAIYSCQIKNLAELKNALSTTQKLCVFSEKSGLSKDYLTILRQAKLGTKDMQFCIDFARIIKSIENAIE